MNGRRILVTGSEGLIGTAVTDALTRLGFSIRGFDLRGVGANHGDIRERRQAQVALEDCVGVLHLAAVSRVIDGERDPDGCWQTNVEGTRNVLDAVAANGQWMVYASSREVYGQPSSLPASEEAPRNPVNIYGRSKVAAEDLVDAAAAPTAILRFSNVYGWVADHVDRVVPAFARQAVMGQTLRVDGSDHTFDFTHLDDTVRGVLGVVERLEGGFDVPPLHLLTGQPTTLGELARIAVESARSASAVREAPPRSYDVSHFYGDPSRAADVLGWRAAVGIREGVARLVRDFQDVAREVV